MIITSATPDQIVQWFHTADHGQELLCIVLGTSKDDRRKFTSLIREFFEVDAVLGNRVAFLVLHPKAEKAIGLHEGFGRFAVLNGEVHTLRDSQAFRDVSDEGEAYRSQIARECARTMARLVPDFMDLFGVTAAELPAACTLIRGRPEAIIAPLGRDWKDADLRAYLDALGRIANRTAKVDPINFQSLTAHTALLEDGLRELAAKRKNIGSTLDQLARRHKATDSDRRKLAEFLAAPHLDAMALDSVLSNLSFAAAERFKKDGQALKLTRLVSRTAELRQQLGEQLLNETYLKSITEQAEELQRVRAETARLAGQIRITRNAAASRLPAPIVERALRLAEYINTTGDLGEKVAWLIARIRELMPH